MDAPQVKRVFDWVLVVVLLCFFALSGCAHRPPQLESAMRIIATQSETWAGVTVCGTRARSWIADDQLDGDPGDLAGLRAHEAAHRQTAGQFSSCEAYVRWLRSSVNWLQAEAFAFCVQAHVLFAHEKYATLDAAFRDAGLLLRSPAYPRWPLTDASAAELIAISCTKAQ